MPRGRPKNSSRVSDTDFQTALSQAAEGYETEFLKIHRRRGFVSENDMRCYLYSETIYRLGYDKNLTARQEEYLDSFSRNRYSVYHYNFYE